MYLARPARPRPGRMPALLVAVLGLVALAGSAVTVIGSDALWLPAMGDWIRAHGTIPAGIPFVAAKSEGWVNTTALGQLLLSVAHSGGSLGVAAAQIIAVVWALWLLASDAVQRDARPAATALVILALCAGAATALFIARAQMLSLVPFAVLLVLLRREHDRPSARIWWSVPLLALWGNLHGAVLVGVAVLGCYLLLSRLSVAPTTAVAVGVASLVATCVNPGLVRAPHYYAGVFSGQATSDESGMWSRPTLTSPFDVLLILTAVALAGAALRQRRPAWEYAAFLGLALATASAARHGVWLLLFLIVPAATALQSADGSRLGWRPPSVRLTAAVSILALGLSAVILTVRAPAFHAADSEADAITRATAGDVVLAPEPLVESLAAAGASVWASNPLDAFSPPDQAGYLAFVKGASDGAQRAFSAADVVVAVSDTPPARLALSKGFTRITRSGPYILMRRP